MATGRTKLIMQIGVLRPSRFNVSFVTDMVVITTAVSAADEDDAHDEALEAVRQDLGLNLIPIRYQIEIEEID